MNQMRPIEKYQFKHHFLPHPHHKRRASLLTFQAFFIYTLGTLLFFATFKTLPKVMPGVLGYASNITVYDLYTLTNQTRQEYGLNQLRYNADLSKAAQKKAEDMLTQDYWSHISPTGKKPWDFILAVDYDYEYAGENLAKNFDNSKSVVNAWYASRSHRENLLNPNYQEIGFAVVNGVLEGYETTLVVQMFGTNREPANLASGDSDPIPTNTVPNFAQPIVNGETQSLQSRLYASSLQNLNVNVSKAPQYLVLGFFVFLTALLIADIWYSHKKGIIKITGHTFAHIIFLIFTLSAVLLTLSPGRIL